jgi:hypothetical protein
VQFLILPPPHWLWPSKVERARIFWFETFDNNFLKLRPINYFRLFQFLDAYNKSHVTNSHKWHDNITNYSKSLYILKLSRFLKFLNIKTRYYFQLHIKSFQNIKKGDIHSDVLTSKSQKYVNPINSIQTEFFLNKNLKSKHDVKVLPKSKYYKTQ